MNTISANYKSMTIFGVRNIVSFVEERHVDMATTDHSGSAGRYKEVLTHLLGIGESI